LQTKQTEYISVACWNWFC